MKINIKISLITLLVFIVLVVLSFVFSKGFLINKENIVVSLKWKNQAQFAGMYVADKKGFYRQSGINVKFKEFDSNISQIDDLINGISDVALISAEEFILFVDQGKDIKAIASIYQTSPYVIVTLANSGIKTPADFVGKNLGIKGGKMEEKLFYLLLLKDFGISSDKVRINDLGFNKKEVDDLTSGNADTIGLYRTDQLYYFDKRKVNYNLIYPEQFGININNDILVVKNKFIIDHPNVVKSFVQATRNGWEYAIANKDEAVNITLNYVTDDNYKDSDYELYILNNSIPLIRPGSNYVIGHIRSSVFEKLYSSMKDNNFITNDFNISDFYTNIFNE